MGEVGRVWKGTKGVREAEAGGLRIGVDTL